jgi:hypothetical protein
MAFANAYFPASYFPGRYFPPLEDATDGAAQLTRRRRNTGSRHRSRKRGVGVVTIGSQVKQQPIEEDEILALILEALLAA